MYIHSFFTGEKNGRVGKEWVTEFRKVGFARKGRQTNGERQKYGFTGTLFTVEWLCVLEGEEDRPGTIGICPCMFLGCIESQERAKWMNQGRAAHDASLRYDRSEIRGVAWKAIM